MSRVLIAPFLSLVGLCAAGAADAQTRTCQSEIARLQALIARAEAGGPPAAPDMTEGTFATMHRQPTAATVLAADKDAMARAKAGLKRAGKLQAQGKDAACLEAIDDLGF
jgi:uncharacterized protein YggE